MFWCIFQCVSVVFLYICFIGDTVKKRRLKPGVVPSLHLPLRSHDKEVLSPIKRRKEQRAHRAAKRALGCVIFLSDCITFGLICILQLKVTWLFLFYNNAGPHQSTETEMGRSQVWRTFKTLPSVAHNFVAFF